MRARGSLPRACGRDDEREERGGAAPRVEQAARGGKVHLLLHSADAGADGRRKLDQAWRVGGSEELGHRSGLEIPAPRTILSMALGRENVVHIALTDRAASKRVSEALDRWLCFIGPEPFSAPCGTAPQGASALPAGFAPSAATN